MWIVFIAILIVVGLIALHLNISNYRDSKKPTPKHQENLQYINQQDIERNERHMRDMEKSFKEQNERILKMFDNKGAV